MSEPTKMSHFLLPAKQIELVWERTESIVKIQG